MYIIVSNDKLLFYKEQKDSNNKIIRCFTLDISKAKKMHLFEAKYIYDNLIEYNKKKTKIVKLN